MTALMSTPLLPSLRGLLLPLVVLMLALLTLSVIAEQASEQNQPVLLDDSEYRTDIEEMVVRARRLDWRNQQVEQEWRPERFELPEQSSEQRMQWLPRYSKDERDQFDGVRDRMGEKPEIKLFEWKF
jgi:hypothetical protein